MPASLLSISIRGIRSYSPELSKTQTIDFMPLTLIVGSNGSGKTSIIESLRFIISGEEPPLSDSRRNFLNTSKDSVSVDKKLSHAAIELHFQSHKDNLCIAKRDLVLGVRNSTPSVSSCYKVDNGAWNHVHRQEDWNKTLPNLFNIPNQALLNNVVLCHQENNLWCMGDSGTIKQIFDRIFGCEQYKKEIRHIEAEIKNCKHELELSSTQVTNLREKVQQKKLLTSQLESFENELEKMDLDTKFLDEEIENTAESKDKTIKMISKIEAEFRTIESLKLKLKDLSGRAKSVRDSLSKQPIDTSLVSDADLEMKLKHHINLVEETKRQQSQMKRQQDSLKSTLEDMEVEKKMLQDSINKLKVIELKSRETEATLLKSLEEIKVEQCFNDIDLTDIRASLEAMENYEKGLIQKKSDQTELEDSLSNRYRDLIRCITKIDGAYQGLHHRINNKEEYVRKLAQQLAESDPIANDLIGLSENFNKMVSLIRAIPRSDIVESIEDLILNSKSIIEGLIFRFKMDVATKLNKEITTETEEIEDSKRRIKVALEEKTKLASERDLVDNEQVKAKSAAKEAHNKVMVFSNLRKNIILTFEKLQQEKRFLECKDCQTKMSKLSEVESQAEIKKKELNAITFEYTKLSDELGQSFERHEEYKNNMQLREILKQTNEIHKEISGLEKKIEDATQLDKLMLKLKQIERQELDLRDKRSMMTGRKIQLRREKERVLKDIRSHHKTCSSYSESLGRVVLNEIIMNDLEKLKECFQESVTSFHNQMSIKINEVLRLRWRQIYQGTDIDYIELVEEEATRGKDRKTFNYYLAMRKNGLRMKMREKSSAGQRALASIILKMTLAELFVKDFAFIALDEPTANLDLANVQSLAKAIGAYVKMRNNKGVNIQWIIITHDETFLKALDVECSPYYYRVQLAEDGFTRIIKSPYQMIS